MDITLTNTSPKDQIIAASSLAITLPGTPVRYYRHGWQSWTLAAWMDPTKELPVMKPDIFHPRQTDPVYALHPHPNGSWLGAVELSDGKIVFLGALGLEAHVAIHDGKLQGWYETGDGEWLVAHGVEANIFDRYAKLIGERFGYGKVSKPPRVWCSWYSLYKQIDEERIQVVIDALGDLPFDVIQIDDGWQVATGDWEPNAKFPSGMDGIAVKIRTSGRKAGLWLAPLAVSETSTLFKKHPEWLLQGFDGKPVFYGYEWGGNAYALDATHPDAAKWLEKTIQTVTGWGYEYLKLDFLAAGALPGKRHTNMPREAAYRHALSIMRQAAGDSYLLTCGAPILPSLGLCDAMRIGPDVASSWDNWLFSYLLYNQTTPGVKNAIRTTVNRLWLKPLVNVDPDVAYFHDRGSLTNEQRQLFKDLTEICEFKATSDLPGSWSPEEMEEVQNWLERAQESTRVGRYSFTIADRRVDFIPAMELPSQPRGFDSFLRGIMSWLGNQLWVLKIWDLLLRTKPEDVSKSGN